MTATWILAFISPVFAVAAVLAAVIITALIRARPEDVPKVITAFVTAFGKLAEAAVASTRVIGRIRPDQQLRTGSEPLAPDPGALAAQPAGEPNVGTETPRELA
ncbi:hypothetical protein AB0F72_17625 [Actinoplanes sp. NPDC023936]|uniref:hypothetical protein n=1 Tax=Actinoplanes sp. NPDC023936 TaxID=3154910 RepID=UPI00340F4B15